MSDLGRGDSHRVLDEWLKSCTRNGRIARNTIAMGVVVLHHLRQAAPVSPLDVISRGGEVTGARSGLGNILETYQIPREYLKEITTRQAHQDGQRLFKLLKWGKDLARLDPREREDTLLELIGILRDLAQGWMRRQNLRLSIDRQQAPANWINIIIENAKGRSGGVVEQHLVGAKLERRFSNITVPSHPAHAADSQTDRAGDFTVSKLVYHVTAAPSRNVLQKCAGNLRVGLHPLLLVPREQEARARILAQDEGVATQLTILAIEDFVSLNIIELATQESKDFFTVLKEIVEIYNRRLAQVETDLSLQIEVR